MSESKHTPGPWRVHHTTIHGKTYGAPWIEPEDDETDIQISGSGGATSFTRRIVEFRGTDVDEVNAAFIVRAVNSYDTHRALIAELVEALEASQSALAMLTEPKEIRTTSVQQAWAVAVDAELKARRALAKAKAESAP